MNSDPATRSRPIPLGVSHQPVPQPIPPIPASQVIAGQSDPAADPADPATVPAKPIPHPTAYVNRQGAVGYRGGQL